MMMMMMMMMMMTMLWNLCFSEVRGGERVRGAGERCYCCERRVGGVGGRRVRCDRLVCCLLWFSSTWTIELCIEFVACECQ